MKSSIGMVIVDGKPSTNPSSISRQTQQQSSLSQPNQPSTTPSAGSNDNNSNTSNNNKETQPPSSSQKSEWKNMSEEQGDTMLTGLMKLSS